ncbi:DNA excision repair protein ERCC-6-like [Discoglossus pictus]
MAQRGSSDHSECSRSRVDSDIKEEYERYVKKGKHEAKNGNLLKSIELFRMANNIHPSEKLKGRIEKLEEALQQLNLQDEEEEFVDVLNSGLMVYKDLYSKLFEHQKEGVSFLYCLYKDGRKGGILADDMGLGKTIQIIAFLSGMFDSELIRCVLLIMPTTLISNWIKEFAKWTPGMRVSEFHGTSKKERASNLERIQRKSGILITTYQMLINNWQQVSTYNEKEFVWDYVILDEAHKIKTSSTKTAKACQAIPSKNRILLTGTPIQNNLREMWSLYDFACQGSLLGTLKTFKIEYENPITRAREKDATPGEKALGLKISENLMQIIQPYFLRRTKSDVQEKKLTEQKASVVKNVKALEMPSLTRKNDLILWVYLSTIQEEIYKKFISLDQIKELLMTKRSPLAELTILKKLCDHPRLLSARACIQLGLEGDDGYNVEGDHDQNSGDGCDDQNSEGAHSAVMKYDHLSDEALIEESGKLRVLIDLLHNLTEQGHRALVFSQSRKMLDIVARILDNSGFKVMRIDGTVPLPEREKRISMFQRSNAFSVLLLTTQVGGVGLTLTSADRVIIFDPSWNPATDAQAVDRAYRIGQQENVVIYRLITCGTVEEKIYRRQIFKDSLIRQTTGDKKNPFRYFSKQELKELFSIEDTRTSSTQIQLQNMHAAQRKTDQQLDNHITFLHTLQIFGISDHDLIYTNETCSQEDDCHQFEEHEDQYIEQRVQKAHELVQLESQMNKQLMEQIQNGTEGAWLRQTAYPERPKERSLPNSKPLQPVTVDLTVDAVGDISCQMTSMVIEDSLGNQTGGSFSFTSSNVPNLNTSECLLIENDIQQNTKSPVAAFNIQQNTLPSSPMVKNNIQVVAPSISHSSSEQVNDSKIANICDVLAASDSLPVDKPQQFHTSGLVMMEDSIEENMSVSKSHLACDFNLVLEDSADNQSRRDFIDASMQEMNSVMEECIAPVKEAMLVLEHSMEDTNVEGVGFDTSKTEKKANKSEAMENSDIRLEMKDCTPDSVEISHHEKEKKINPIHVSDGMNFLDEDEEDDIPCISKKRATRRISSDSETENSECLAGENSYVFSPFNSSSINGIKASTPKLDRNCGSVFGTQNIIRRRSIASRRSLVHVAVEETEYVNETIDNSSEEEDKDDYVVNEAEEVQGEEESETSQEPAGETVPLEETESKSMDEYESNSFVVRNYSDQEEECNTEEMTE